MNYKNFINYTSLNLISICGYLISIAFILTYSAIFFFGDAMCDYITKENPAYTSPISGAIVILYGFILLFLIAIIYGAILFFLLMLPIENYLYNKNKIKLCNFFDNSSKKKKVIFWIGIFLIPTPIYIVLITLFLEKLTGLINFYKF